jgi:hypothetical protein
MPAAHVITSYTLVAEARTITGFIGGGDPLPNQEQNNTYPHTNLTQLIESSDYFVVVGS